MGWWGLSRPRTPEHQHPGAAVHSIDRRRARAAFEFSAYRYPDPRDPQVVAVDTITSDLVLTDPDQVAHYQQLYRHLRDAALGVADSLDLLAAVAEELHRTGRNR